MNLLYQVPIQGLLLLTIFDVVGIFLTYLSARPILEIRKRKLYVVAVFVFCISMFFRSIGLTPHFLSSEPFNLVISQDNESTETVLVMNSENGDARVFWNLSFKKGLAKVELDKEVISQFWILDKSKSGWNALPYQIPILARTDTIQTSQITKPLTHSLLHAIQGNRISIGFIWFSHILGMLFLIGLVLRMWKWEFQWTK